MLCVFFLLNLINILLPVIVDYGIINLYKYFMVVKIMAKQKYLECGRAISTHGVRGTLRLESYCDTPEKLAKMRRLYYKNSAGEYIPMKVRAASIQKHMVLCTFEEITTLDDAIPYKGVTFYADRDDMKLPKGEHFIADMIGLNVIDAENGEIYGTLTDVITPGGRNVYVVDDVNGGQFMIPAVDEFVKKIETDGDNMGIYVKLIEGMRE